VTGGTRTTLLAAGIALVAMGGCFGESPSSKGRLEVLYRDGRTGVDHTTVVTVHLGSPVPRAPTRWRQTFLDQGCEGDGRTLVLTDPSGHPIEIGDPCDWDEKEGEVSPDGSYLPAWVLGDGAGAMLHLIDLTVEPADLGEVPDSRSADYIATWSPDDRVWFTSDDSPTSAGRLFSFHPGDAMSVSVSVHRDALIRSVRAVR
jgi:hypothetical protein